MDPEITKYMKFSKKINGFSIFEVYNSKKEKVIRLTSFKRISTNAMGNEVKDRETIGADFKPIATSFGETIEEALERNINHIKEENLV